MKKGLKILGIILGSLITLLLLFVAYINFSAPPTYEVIAPELIVKLDSTSIAKGAQMAQMTCFSCHMNNGKLEGLIMEDETSEVGMVWAANITQHKTAGIGNYTDGELVYLLRTGTKRDGQYAPPWMPKFPHLSDEDIYDIVAYLRSDRPEVQASDKIQPKAKPSFLGKALIKLVFRPLPYDGKPINAPPVTDKVAYGAYIANSKLDCFSCHSEDFKTQNILEPQKTPGFYGGGNRFNKYEELVISANITPDKKTGIGNWNEDQFTKVLKFGVKPDGTPIRFPMTPFPLLSDEEISTIWAYLQTIPAISNDVKAMY